MPVSTATELSQDVEDVAVGMGLAVLAAAPARLTAVVGSCIGVTVYSPKLRLGMLSHVVLPHAKGRTAYPAKYADTAVDHMRSVLEGRGVPGREACGQNRRRRLHVRRRRLHADRRGQRASRRRRPGGRRHPHRRLATSAAPSDAASRSTLPPERSPWKASASDPEPFDPRSPSSWTKLYW